MWVLTIEGAILNSWHYEDGMSGLHVYSYLPADWSKTLRYTHRLRSMLTQTIPNWGLIRNLDWTHIVNQGKYQFHYIGAATFRPWKRKRPEIRQNVGVVFDSFVELRPIQKVATWLSARKVKRSRVRTPKCFSMFNTLATK